jgi:hypothetical protein
MLVKIIQTTVCRRVKAVDPPWSVVEFAIPRFSCTSNTSKYSVRFAPKKSYLVVYWLVCLPLDPRVTDSNPAKGNKIPQCTFFQRRSKAVGAIS